MSDANPEPSDNSAASAANKRYEGLVALRTKAINGKGAWYWAHFDPVLIRNPDTNLPKAVKLRCTLCNAAFSASNPSRTASEHLKRGTCPNFRLMLNPASQHLPPLASPSSRPNHRKRTSDSLQAAGAGTSYVGIQTTEAPCSAPKPPVLSGGREDLKPLALLEDSVKKLKSPKSSPVPSLTKEQVTAAFDLLADWFFESFGSVSFSSIENPKFKAFLSQLGLPQVSRREFAYTRLDSKYEKARRDSEARISDAAFFQVASDRWKRRSCANGDGCLINFTVNLPNETRVFQRVVYCNGGAVPLQYVEEVLWETVRGVCGDNPRRCVGIIADKHAMTALRNLELQHNWMINVPCLIQVFLSLIKDLYRELPLFTRVTNKCLQIANLVNSQPQIRSCFHKFRLQGLEHDRFIRVPLPKCDISKNLGPFVGMLEDVLTCSQTLQLVVLDDSFKLVCLDDHAAREIADMIQDVGFWNDVEAAHSLVKLIMAMGEEIEAERPLIGECLPLWKQLRDQVREWCAKYSVAEAPMENIIEKRFKKNYHPAWSAAFVLDPLYLVRDVSGKYLPPFKFLTHEQEKDVDRIVTRLVSEEEPHVVLMELMKWRSEGLDPLYAQAVQVKKLDPLTGKMKIANPQSSRIVWETCLKEFRSLGKVAAQLLFLHATSCGIKCDWSFTRWFCGQGSSRLGFERAQKLVFIAAHAELERQDFSSSEEKDAELFGSMISSEDDMLNEVLARSSSI